MLVVGTAAPAIPVELMPLLPAIESILLERKQQLIQQHSDEDELSSAPMADELAARIGCGIGSLSLSLSLSTSEGLKPITVTIKKKLFHTNI